jgi:hypothetical protein
MSVKECVLHVYTQMEYFIFKVRLKLTLCYIEVDLSATKKGRHA